MKRPGYRHAIQWIADNDEPEEMDVEVLCELITINLVADIFNVSAERVAKDVARKRKCYSE